VEAKYANGTVMLISDKYPNGLKFMGENGWIWVTRGKYTPGPGKAFNASDPKILTAGIKDNEIHLHVSPKEDHHLDWLTSIRTRQPPAAPAEDGHRACTTCLISHAAMKLGRKLRWDPKQERFIDDEKANAFLSRKQRAPYGTNSVG
jgi:hypothetical protein